MRLNILLYVETGDALHVYRRETTRNYERVPVVEETIFIDDRSEYALPIDSVSWANDGTPTLECRLDAGADEHFGTWAGAAGYVDVTPDAR